MPNNRAQSLRIIGGEWRGRRLTFPNIKTIRPTPDKLRETLFNWLQFDIVNKNCLDLFAGSGMLGLEALSRGAKNVVFVEQNRVASNAIKSHLTLLKNNSSKVFCDKVERFLNRCDEIFEVVFLDPPFNKPNGSQQNLLKISFDLLIKHNIINKSSLVFIETEQADLDLPVNILKTAKSGQSHIYLTRL